MSAGVVTVVSLMWHFAIPTRLTGGSTLAFFLALFILWIAVGWIVREMSWTQRKYDPEQFINMCISFHVDLYCIWILFMIFCFFVLNDSCHEGPIGCLPTCLTMCGVQGQRCAGFICGISGRSGGTQASPDGQAPPDSPTGTSRKSQSQHVEKEVETADAWRRRKMINAACAFGILGLAGISFFAPQLSFAIALALCVGLPFFRAAQNKEEDHSNV